MTPYLKLLGTLLAFCPTLLWGQLEKTYWSNGNLQSEGMYNKDGLKTGLWKYYYTTGKLESTGSYIPKGIKKPILVVRSTTNSWLEDSKGNETRDGQWLFYHTNGRMKAKVMYEKGCPIEMVTKWHANGVKKEESEYIECKAGGVRKIWSPENKLIFETQILRGGKMLEVEWHENGNKKSEIPYINGAQEGTIQRWYENGAKEEVVEMKNTRVHGWYRSWYKNGKPQREFYSKNNVMLDVYKEWNGKGELTQKYSVTQNMDDNDELILVETFWDGGIPKMKGTSKFTNNKSINQWNQIRHGQWTYWGPDGSILKTENYQDGRLMSIEMP